MPPALLRFFKYSLVGGGTFAFDLLLLFVFVDVLNLPVTLSAGVAFLIAVTINYFLSRRYVFAGTLRSVGEGYRNFLLIVLIGLGLVTVGMHVLVTVLGLNYLFSRVAVAAVAGLWNYFLNLYVNFKVAGKY